MSTLGRDQRAASATAEPDPACAVCGNAEGNSVLRAREMMFGMGDAFAYVACGACDCLRISAVPTDLARYYAADYYSLSTARAPWLERWAKGLRVRALFGRGSTLGRLLLRRFGAPPALRAVRHADVPPDTPTLDVGCGAGHLLLALRSAGYSALTGIDPYLDADREPAPGLRLLRRELDELSGSFGLIMLHHSLEHVPDPQATLQRVHDLLRPGGRALVRTPVAGSYAARHYGAEWVQLDAPRHLTVQSERSLRLLTAVVGLRVDEVVYDSDGFQFWGSEQYRRGLPLVGPGVVPGHPHAGQFTAAELSAFAERAAALNAAGDGDQACFYLSRPLS